MGERRSRNGAGFWSGFDPVQQRWRNFRVSFDEQTEEMWNLVLGTILTGSFLGTKP